MPIRIMGPAGTMLLFKRCAFLEQYAANVASRVLS